VRKSKSFDKLKPTTVLGGQETTALVNACTIFMLAHHQDVQNKVHVDNFVTPTLSRHSSRSKTFARVSAGFRRDGIDIFGRRPEQTADLRGSAGNGVPGTGHQGNHATVSAFADIREESGRRDANRRILVSGR